MKFIIELDERRFKDLQRIASIQMRRKCLTCEQIIANGIPLSEELEKIKEEIQGLIDFEESCCGNTALGYQCLGVIKDRISELKGENNDKI